MIIEVYLFFTMVFGGFLCVSEYSYNREGYRKANRTGTISISRLSKQMSRNDGSDLMNYNRFSTKGYNQSDVTVWKVRYAIELRVFSSWNGTKTELKHT